MSTIESALLKKLKEYKDGVSKKDNGNHKKENRAYSNVTPAYAEEETTSHNPSASKDEFLDDFLKPEETKSRLRERTISPTGIASMSQKRRFTPAELSNRGLISSDAGDSRLLNEYRNLRTRLLSTTKSENFITLVTSVNVGHDTSLVAANLAATFALEAGKTAMLLNADMSSNEKIDQIFDIQPEYGLVDFIESQEMSIEEIIYETPIPRLRYVPIGNVGAEIGEYFSTSRMKTAMSDFVSRYKERFPIINAPSIASSADTRILLGLCDRVVLVIPYGQCSEEIIQQATLSVGKDKLAGVVLENF